MRVIVPAVAYFDYEQFSVQMISAQVVMLTTMMASFNTHRGVNSIPVKNNMGTNRPVTVEKPTILEIGWPYLGQLGPQPPEVRTWVVATCPGGV